MRTLTEIDVEVDFGDQKNLTREELYMYIASIGFKNDGSWDDLADGLLKYGGDWLYQEYLLGSTAERRAMAHLALEERMLDSE